MPYQVVGVTRPGGEDGQHRVFGVGVVVALKHVAVGILHRGHASFVEYQKLAVAHGDRIIFRMPIWIAIASVLAVVGHRLGGDIKAPRRRVAGRVDLHHRGIQQTLGTVSPGAIRLAHGRVGALNQIQQMRRHVRVGGRVIVGVGAELETVGHVVAVGTWQPGDVGLGSTREITTTVQRDLGNASAEFRHAVIATVERDRVIVSDPQHVRIGGIDRQADDAPTIVAAFSAGFEEIIAGQGKLLAIDQRSVAWVDVEAQDLPADGRHVHCRAVGGDLQRRETEGIIRGAIEFDHIVEGHIAGDDFRLLTGDEGVGVLLELASRRISVIIGAAVLEAINHQSIAGERFKRLAW